MRHTILVTVSLSLLVLSQLLQACTREHAVEKSLPVVNTTTVQQASQEQKQAQKQALRYSAVVVPVVQIDLAFRSSGYVASIAKVRSQDGQSRLIHEGDFVARGAQLAALKRDDNQARLQEQVSSLDEIKASDSRALATVTEAQAGLKQAEEEFARTSRLYDSNSVTKPEFEAARAKVVVSQARLKEAQSQLAVNQAAKSRAGGAISEARTALADCVLRAPCDGVIVKRNIEEGMLVSGGTAAIVIADPAKVKVVFGVPDVNVNALKIGQTLECTSEAVPDKQFRGKISDIAPGADPKGRVFNVEVSLANPGHKLKPGMVVSILVDQPATVPANQSKRDLPTETRGLFIPLSAVVRSTKTADGYAVFVARTVDGKTTVDERQVQLGDVFGQMIAVQDGLNPGDVVVTTGSAQIGAGQEVRLLN